MRNTSPLKRFGQNYLIDKNIIRKIVNEFAPQPNDNVIEIGPGHGSITEELLTRIDKMTAIEIDKRVTENLQKKFPNLNLITDDFLKIDLAELMGRNLQKLRIIGNIPFNITSPLVFKLLESHGLVKDCVLMVQYEVAKRFSAKKGTKDYGILSVLLNYFAEVKFCFKVSPNVFRPKPNVYSAVIHLSFNEKLDKSINDMLFINVVKASFGNRRKTLKNSLSNSIFSSCNFENSGIDLKKRAEDLDISEFLKLTTHLSGRSYVKQ